jgi:iron complex transport system ATP-binding protein
MAVTLSVDDVAYGYPGKPVGRGANFEFNPGEVLCVLGPNGSGKTTLFKTILGLLPPQAGAVRMNGEDISRWTRRRVARLMGYVPQAHSAYFPFSVLEAVLMGRTAHIGLFSVPTRSDVTVAERTLDMLRIGHLRDNVYTRISGGERQLTLIARALAQESKILIMDEPTASLDFGNQMSVLDHIRALARRGIGVMFSTHDPDHAFLCAQRVALLHDGELVHLGTPEETITSERLHRLYGAHIDVVELPDRLGTDGRPMRVCVPAVRPG